MKNGFDIHDFDHRMQVDLRRTRENSRMSLHNRLRILKFLDYQGREGVGFPKRIKYTCNLTKLATMSADKGFEMATEN